MNQFQFVDDAPLPEKLARRMVVECVLKVLLVQLEFVDIYKIHF